MKVMLGILISMALLASCEGGTPEAPTPEPTATPDVAATVSAAVQSTLTAIPAATPVPSPTPLPTPTATPVIIESAISAAEAIARFRVFLEAYTVKQVAQYLDFEVLNQGLGCVAVTRVLSANEVLCDPLVVSVGDAMSKSAADSFHRSSSGDIEATHEGKGTWKMVVHVSDARDVEDQQWHWFENEDVEPQLIE